MKTTLDDVNDFHISNYQDGVRRILCALHVIDWRSLLRLEKISCRP